MQFISAAAVALAMFGGMFALLESAYPAMPDRGVTTVQLADDDDQAQAQLQQQLGQQEVQQAEQQAEQQQEVADQEAQQAEQQGQQVEQQAGQ